jgi:hypothetical protein
VIDKTIYGVMAVEAEIRPARNELKKRFVIRYK